MVPYRPEPLTPFAADPAEQKKLNDSLGKILKQLGQDYPLLIEGKQVQTAARIVSINPSDDSQTVGISSKADLALAEQAVQSALQAYGSWSRVKPEARTDVLLKAAAIMRRRKHEFTGWLMLEAGKNQAEADADTAEAIDFLEYYARQMLELSERGRTSLTRIPGENNRLEYIPLGVGVVIAPWNFPLAILAGMTTAAVVAGNTVVVKPSSLTPVIAYKFVELMLEAGLPEDVIQLVPGDGSVIGEYLVKHPSTRFISFTGSKEAGLRIHRISAEAQPGQVWLKRFVGEMGGKDTILVDRSADVEAAARGIVASAFGFSGQKCSACSRAVVHQAVYKDVLDRCVKLAEAWKVGHVQDPTVDTGPVIDEASCKKIMSYIEIAKSEGRLVAGGSRMEGPGFFIRPTIVADVAPTARVMQEEVFGPLLAFTSCESFEQGLDISNNTEYGLTGAVYSRDRRHLELARERFHVGNLYLNRKCTGAIVGVHPFGGFNMSGTDSKAGGPDYLMQFTQAKLVSEFL